MRQPAQVLCRTIERSQRNRCQSGQQPAVKPVAAQREPAHGAQNHNDHQASPDVLCVARHQVDVYYVAAAASKQLLFEIKRYNISSFSRPYLLG